MGPATVLDVGRSLSPIRRPADIALIGVFLIGFSAWGVAVARLPCDYDEVYNAHAIWLVARGDRPYNDFLAVHTPFLWYAPSVLFRWLPDSPRMLVPLRISTGIGVLIWLAALLANFACINSNLSLQWMLAGLGIVLFSIPVLAYAVEFRPDAWAFALFFSALLLHRRQSLRHTGFWKYACYAFFATLAAISCLKVAPFAALFAAFELLGHVCGRRRIRGPLSGYVAGTAAALAISWLLLKSMRLDLYDMYQFAFHYQVIFERNTGFSHGLARSLADNPLSLLVACSGLLFWAIHTVRTRTAPDPFHASLAAVLVWELLAVHRPYKQYYGPWLLTAAPFFAFVEAHWKLPVGDKNWRLLPVVVLGGMAAAGSLALLRQNGLGPRIQQLQDQIVARSDKDSPIVAAPPFHPIIRKDVFYAWSRTTDPRGYTTEPAMSELGYGDLVSAERYRDELAARNPSVIVLPLPGEELYEPLQWQIVLEFLRGNSEHYEIVTDGLIRSLAVKRAATPEALRPTR